MLVCKYIGLGFGLGLDWNETKLNEINVNVSKVNFYF